MAEFDQIQAQLDKARSLVEKAKAAEAALRSQLDAKQTQLDSVRRFRPASEAAILQADATRLAAEAKRARTNRLQAEAREAKLLRDFLPLNDPRKTIAQLKDRIPILLFPVRLETRFKLVSGPVGIPPAHELWVRIYPDTCSIDTFEPLLSRTEVATARVFWIRFWEAGGVEDDERAAFRDLAASHGPARAEYIVRTLLPVNMAMAPRKVLSRDVVLVIPTTDLPSASDQGALADYWKAVWGADANPSAEQAAREALEQKIGSGVRAQELIAVYTPANAAQEPLPPFTRTQVNVSIAFLQLPKEEDIPTRKQSWSQKPKAVLLPDRFLFVGVSGADRVEVLGDLIPTELAVGPDPNAPAADQMQQDKDGNLIVPDELKWMMDFDAALKVGMGIRVPLTAGQALRGFDRVIVVGLRLRSDEKVAKAELETLFDHHRFSASGIAIVPQGTPTNNTEGSNAGFSLSGDPDERFTAWKRGTLVRRDADFIDKQDGQWLAEYLGIDASVTETMTNAACNDQADARCMNTALWPATMGYWMESMMNGVFTEDGMEATREFFTNFVLGRGGIPALRIGRQPYGILPATVFSQMKWPFAGASFFGPAGTRQLPFLRTLNNILQLMDADWRTLSNQVAHTGQSGDPHKTLLDILGLHPNSVEYAQRYAESAEQVLNRLNMVGLANLFGSLILAGIQETGKAALARLGFTGTNLPEILKKFFFGTHNQLKGPVIDDRPISETERIRAYTESGANYIEWLLDATQKGITALYQQQGFKNNEPPRALLYLLLRHALQLGYHDTSLKLLVSAQAMTKADAQQAKVDEAFIHMAGAAHAGETRYQALLATNEAITGSRNLTVGEFIGAKLKVLPVASHLREQTSALGRLRHASTARLERAFVEHLDTCSYRLDSWLLAMLQYQLCAMRNIENGVDVEPEKGIYLGAYAWLENLRPDRTVKQKVALDDADLKKVFLDPAAPPLETDSENEGYIHAPSLNQAVAAAVLRNGYLSNATPANHKTMAVNLSSERVRRALALMEGIRGGQSIGALLGYQFERGLHDSHAVAEVDQFIFGLRKAFPLVSDRMASTRSAQNIPIEAVEARNVLDGLALVNQMQTSPANAVYPFGKAGLLSSPNAAQAGAINTEAQKLLEAYDAVADLALSEGIYQAVLGNYDRVGSTLDAFAKGDFPPEPQVVRTPSNGTGLTHRFALHLNSSADPKVSPIPGIPISPRAQAEPALNAWLAGVIPDPASVACLVQFHDANTNAPAMSQVSLLDLAVQPIDLLYFVRDDHGQNITELDDRLLRFTSSHSPVRPDHPMEIRYMEKGTALCSFFELMPLLRHLRRLILSSRPLRPSDLSLMNEATSTQDSAVLLDKSRATAVVATVQALKEDFKTFAASLKAPLDDLDNRRNDILTAVDTNASQMADLLVRAAGLGLVQSGWAFIGEFQARFFRGAIKKCDVLKARWDDRLAEADGLIAHAEALPAGSPPEEKLSLLARAELLLSTVATAPLPADPNTLLTTLKDAKRPTFIAKRSQVAAITNTSRTQVVPLLSDLNGLLPIAHVDFIEFDFTEEEQEIITFTDDCLRTLGQVVAELDQKLARCTEHLTEFDATTDNQARLKALEPAMKALLGDDFKVIPHFTLSPDHADEAAKCMAASGSLLDYQTNILKTDFPVDTWLYGVARVREKVRSWEQLMMNTGALGRPEPELTPLQFPFLANDHWLAMEFPPDAMLNLDRLLYHAHFASSFSKAAPQCGLLIDEWTEVIPTANADTGIAFHYDRPNNEAPQSMLLVTPTSFTGAWQWSDVIDALNETLDFAKRRPVEPVHLDGTDYAWFLPATVMAVTMRQLNISANLAFNNNLAALLRD